MAEKIYPASKPSAAAAAVPNPTATGNPTFPAASKPHQYNNTRPVYRPQPRRSRRSRSCCCSLCLWITFAIILLILIAAVAGGIVYVLYRPHRPSFSVSAVRVSQFNLTAANKLTTRFDFTVTARNPNKKIAFYYDPITISFDSNGVGVGDGTIPAFTAEKKNTTALKTVVAVSGRSVDEGDDKSGKLRSDLKSKKSLPLKIQLDTKVKAKIGSLKTKKVPIRVTCDGIKAAVPTGKTATVATTSGAKCKVDLRIKIWKWTI